MNSGVFLDTVDARAFKLCMLIILLGIYRFIRGFMTLVVTTNATVSEQEWLCQYGVQTMVYIYRLQLEVTRWCP